jgi:hypothetical protein
VHRGKHRTHRGITALHDAANSACMKDGDVLHKRPHNNIATMCKLLLVAVGYRAWRLSGFPSATLMRKRASSPLSLLVQGAEKKAARMALQELERRGFNVHNPLATSGQPQVSSLALLHLA